MSFRIRPSLCEKFANFTLDLYYNGWLTESKAQSELAALLAAVSIKHTHKLDAFERRRCEFII